METILVGGDRLSEGASRNVQWAFADGESPEDRLEGLQIKFEDWHAIRNLFEVNEFSKNIIMIHVFLIVGFFRL